MSYLLHETITGEYRILKCYLSLALCDDVTKTVWDIFSIYLLYIYISSIRWWTGLEIPGSCDKGSEKSGDLLPPFLPEFTVRIGEWKCRNPGMTVKMARTETMKAN